MSRVAFKQCDLERAARGLAKAARAMGLEVTGLKTDLRTGEVTVLTANGNEPSDAADDMERRMRDAFGA